VDPTSEEWRARLTAWFTTQLSGEAEQVQIQGLDRVALGHSAETMLLTLTWREQGRAQARDLVVRVRPPEPGLLEPYDLQRQFAILRALEATAVRSPRVFWHDDSGDVLGREFYVMERLPGTVYEQNLPDDLAQAPERLARMSRSLVEQIATIHLVDPVDAGLTFLGDGRDFLDRELTHWVGEMHRVQRGTLPALERLVAELYRQRPAPSPRITLVHGDPKPGNFAFVDDEVNAVFDWELTTLGDPLADIGWAEVNWTTPGAFTNRPGALTVDEFVHHYEALTGIEVVHRDWYRAFQGFKMVVIMLVGAMLFDAGASDDLRLASMGMAVGTYTRPALTSLGVDDDIEPGPVTARQERVREVQERKATR